MNNDSKSKPASRFPDFYAYEVDNYYKIIIHIYLYFIHKENHQ